MDDATHTLFLGIGAAGGRMLNAVWDLAPEAPLHAAALHTDAAFLETLAVSRRLVLGGDAAEGCRTAGDPEAGRRAAERSVEALQALSENTRLAVITAGLGGGTGTGAAPVVARTLREAGSLVVAVVTLPFFFEGSQRRKSAEKGLRAIHAAADAVVVFPNQRMLDYFDADASATEAFATVDRVMGEALLALTRVLDGQGLIRLDMTDLRSMVRASGGTLAMSYAGADGGARGAEAVAALTRCPLLEHGHVLASAREVLVCIRGGTDFRLAEAQDVMTRLAEMLHPQADVRLGVDVRPDCDGRIALTVLASETETTPDLAESPATEPESEKPAAERSATEAPAPGRKARARSSGRPVQGSLPLDGSGKGRFRDVEPTLYDGEDLDVPTFLRRGIPLRK